jgi:general secretion pathway protein F
MSRAAFSSGNVSARPGARAKVPAGPRPFLYLAAKPGGGRTMGVRRARSLSALNEDLRRSRLVCLRTWQLPHFGDDEGGRLSLKDQAELNTNLAQLLSRGVPLVEALEVSASSVSSAMRPRVVRMKELVASGASFADACAAVTCFDRVTIAVYRAAERTGDLSGAAAQLAQTARRQLAISGKAVTLMLYPAIVFTISVLVCIGMLTIILPKIGEAMKTTGISLPWYTEAMLSVGLFMKEQALWLLLAVGLVVAALVVFRDGVRLVIGKAMRTIPLLKTVVLAQESARFFTIMAAMSKSGVVLADALGVAEGAVGHPVLKEQLIRLRTRLIEGGVLRYLIDEVTALPLPTRRLMIAAERSGDMQQAFETLAADMADDVEKRSSRLLAILEPLLIVLMFLVIGTMVVSMMIPLINATAGAKV